MSVNSAPISNKGKEGTGINGSHTHISENRCGVNKIKALINKYNSIKSKGLIKSYDETNTCKDYNLKSEIEKTDEKIDEMVYRLYGMIENEKGIIKNQQRFF